jgi:iron complex outermembrane recepter protein
MSSKHRFARLTLWTLAAVATTATAQPPSASLANTEPALQEIIVTGSFIKRTDLETPSPVQVISNADMLQMGYTNVSQVLQNQSAAGQGSLSQSFGEAFASGAQGIALRG